MNQIFSFYFKGTDMRRLIKDSTGYVLVNSEIVVKEIDGEPYGVIKVRASSYRKGETPGVEPTLEETILGCPVPPCVQQDGIIDKACEDKVEKLFQSYVKNLID
jgi:hypothetical protein